MKNKPQKLEKRKLRVRATLRKNMSKDRPRLSVFRSNNHIYAQVINDVEGKTIASASTMDGELRTKLKNPSDKHAAEEVGKCVARRALKAGVTKIVFDRGAYIYHGRVAALAMGARAEGLEF